MTADRAFIDQPSPEHRLRHDFLRQVQSHVAARRQSFRQTYGTRHDAEIWADLDAVTDRLLARVWRHVVEERNPAAVRLDEREVPLVQAIRAVLARQDTARAAVFGDALADLQRQAAEWKRFLGDDELAFWRYALVVWTVLWHAAAAPFVTADDVADALGLRRHHTNPAPPPPKPATTTAVPPPAPSASAKRFGLDDRSVLAGTADFEARRLYVSPARTALGLALSAILGTFVFCVCMTMLAMMGGNPLAAGFWLGAMPVAALCAVVWGWLMGRLMLRGAARKVANATGFEPFGDNHPLQTRVAEMCRRIGYAPVPIVGVFAAQDINGFAAGDSGEARIGVSQGAVKRLTPGEMDALLAHELGHVAAGDMERMLYARCFQLSLVWWLLFAPIQALGRWVFGTLGQLMIFGLSRRREYDADGFGAVVAGKANMLSLLQRLDEDDAPKSSGEKLMPELFTRSTVQRLFATHPTVAARIRAVEREERLHGLRLTYRD
jgi:heat shock protein HtpX